MHFPCRKTPPFRPGRDRTRPSGKLARVNDASRSAVNDALAVPGATVV